MSVRPVDETIAYRGNTTIVRHYLTTETWDTPAANTYGGRVKTRTEAVDRWMRRVDDEWTEETKASFKWLTTIGSDQFFSCPTCWAMVEEFDRVRHAEWHAEVTS